MAQAKIRKLIFGAVAALALTHLTAARASATESADHGRDAASTLELLHPASLATFGNRSGSLARWTSPVSALLRPAMADEAAEAFEPAPDRSRITGAIASKQARPQHPRRQPELLSSVAIAFGKLPALARIAPAYKEMSGDFLTSCRTILCDNAASTLRAVVAANRDGPFLELLAAVNRSVNRLINYRRDSDLYGVMDHWAEPSATLNRGMGDCEDYAILKMAVLAQAGVPSKSMSVVVIRDDARRVYHAILAVQTSKGAYILDNLQAELRRDAELPDYTPLFSVSAGRGYIYGKRTGGKAMVAQAAGFNTIAPGEGSDLAAAWSTGFPPQGARGPF